MPTKLKGMTSLEVAIIVAIVLVIAVAVGWYLYTTFAAAGQPSGLAVTLATVYSDSKTLVLEVIPQGTAGVQLSRIEIAGVTLTCGTSAVVSNKGTYYVSLPNTLNVAVGQVLTGRIILSSGAVTPFTATVVPGSVVPPSTSTLSCNVPTGGS